jgi:hypothetical protein
MIENKVLVIGIYDESASRSIGISKGDIVLSIDGKDPLKMIEDVRKYQNASTKASQTIFICSFHYLEKKIRLLHLKLMDVKGKIKNVYHAHIGKIHWRCLFR